MKRRIVKVLVIFGALLGLIAGCGAEEDNKEIAVNSENIIQEPETETGLKQAIAWEMGWLAIGSQGELLEIQSDGSVEEIQTGTTVDFNDICYDGEYIWIAGADGILLKGDANLDFRKEDVGTSEDLKVCQAFQGNIYCGGKGTLFWSEGTGTWEPCNLRFSGTITGMEVSDKNCLFVTDAGEAVTTADGISWSALSYGEYYGKEVEFQGLIHDGNSFWAYGTTEEGTELFYTRTGAAWGERDINYLDGASVDLSGTRILSMVSDGKQIYAWCEEGVMLTIPECVKCNKKTEIESVQGGTIGYNGGNLLMISDKSELEVMETELAKQYQISGETAYTKSQEGAVIIDVRSQEDYDEKHIKGSVLIPLDELEEKLSQLYPDIGQTIIFYCTKGVRSQTAVEQAVKLGYVEIYSLGSIDNWEHGFE